MALTVTGSLRGGWAQRSESQPTSIFDAMSLVQNPTQHPRDPIHQSQPGGISVVDFASLPVFKRGPLKEAIWVGPEVIAMLLTYELLAYYLAF